MNSCFFGLFLLLGNATPVHSQKLNDKGRLTGIIRNERNEGLGGATVQVGRQIFQTDINGSFSADLDSGSYEMTVSYAGYEKKIISDIRVQQGNVTKQDVVLSSGANEKEVVVTAVVARRESISSVFRVQKNSATVADVMSAEQIRRTPDNNVAQSLSRMNGVTILENKFIVVRGMGERYNNVLLNGSQLPSTEPNRRNFSFDLLPANIIDNIVVTKTASPDMPADFAGGIVQINTKQVPDKNELFFQAGAGYNSNSTGKPFYSTRLHKSEYFTLLNKQKKWYLNDWNPTQYFRLRTSTNAADAKSAYEMNARIPNYWGYYHIGDAMPTQDYQGGFALRKKFKNSSSLGVLGTGSFRNEQLIENYSRQTYFLDSVTGNKYSFNASLSGLVSLAYTARKSKIGFKTIYSRRLNYDTYIFSGRNVDLYPIRNYGIFSNLVWVHQGRLDGEHSLPYRETKLKWFIDASRTNRDQPETRTMSYRPMISGSDAYEIDVIDKVRASSGGIFASHLNEKRIGGGFDLQIPYQLFREKQSFKLGYFGSHRTSDYIFSFLRPILNNESEQDKIYGLPDYAVFTARNLREGIVKYQPLGTRGSKDDDSYTGKQIVQAGFVMTDFKIGKFRIIGGLRAEIFEMNVNTGLERDTLSGKITKDTISGIRQTDLFPSANFIYSLNSRSNIRLSASRTTARPDFRELSPVIFYDFSLPGAVIGNSFLGNTLINNADLRYELFPTANEIVTFTLFYKQFKNPIETLVQPTASSEFLYINVNQSSSSNIGGEVDFRKSFDFISKKSGFFRNLFLSCNASYMSSEVTVDRRKLSEILKLINPSFAFDSAKEDQRKRPLQGLSPYSVNAGLLYQGTKHGFNIVFNRIGKRLVFLGTEDYTDFYENSRNVIDIQFYKKFFKQKMEVRLNFSDLLSDNFLYYNNSTGATGTTKPNGDPKGDEYNEDYDFVIYKAQRGRGVSISINYRL